MIKDIYDILQWPDEKDKRQTLDRRKVKAKKKPAMIKDLYGIYHELTKGIK